MTGQNQVLPAFPNHHEIVAAKGAKPQHDHQSRAGRLYQMKIYQILWPRLLCDSFEIWPHSANTEVVGYTAQYLTAQAEANAYFFVRKGIVYSNSLLSSLLASSTSLSRKPIFFQNLCVCNRGHAGGQNMEHALVFQHL